MKKMLVFSISPAPKDANSWLQKNEAVYLVNSVTKKHCNFHKMDKNKEKMQPFLCWQTWGCDTETVTIRR